MKTIRYFKSKYRFLSNFSNEQPFMWRGQLWPTSEHAFQWAKTDNENFKNLIRYAETPADAKAFGRMAPLRDDWEEDRVEVMHEILRAKFSHPWYGRKLLETGDARLIEGNHWGDRFWGACWTDRCDRHERGFHWCGENRLGTLLMEIRDEIRGGR